MTISTKIYSAGGEHIVHMFHYEIDGNQVIISDPKFSKNFGEGWQDDLVEAFKDILDFDFQLVIR